MLVRAATQEDAETVALLAGQLGYSTTSEHVVGLLTISASRDDDVVYVADIPDLGVVGWIHVFEARRIMYAPAAEIGGLVVHSDHRARGVGQALLAQAEEWARQRGCALVRVKSNIIRDGAHAFYEHLGYRCVKQQRVFERSL